MLRSVTMTRAHHPSLALAALLLASTLAPTAHAGSACELSHVTDLPLEIAHHRLITTMHTLHIVTPSLVAADSSCGK